jgi:6-phosphofructo-2-kinase/fructose-2,6-biphosphatase 2
LSLPQDKLPYIAVSQLLAFWLLENMLTAKIPLHTLIKITPMAYGVHEERYPLPIAAVDTHRPKPSKRALAQAQEEPSLHSASAPARDYFGDSKNQVAAVTRALEGAKADDDLEPKVVKQ